MSGERPTVAQRLARVLGRRRSDDAEPSGGAQDVPLDGAAKDTVSRLLRAAMTAQRAGLANEARRLLEQVRDERERQAGAREVEEKVRSRPGGYWDPRVDGPL